jgi:hypothetical protein
MGLSFLFFLERYTLFLCLCSWNQSTLSSIVRILSYPGI